MSRLFLEIVGEPESPSAASTRADAAVPSLPPRYQFLPTPRLAPSPGVSENALLLGFLDLSAAEAIGIEQALPIVAEDLTGQLDAFCADHLSLSGSHRLYHLETLCSIRPRELVFHRLVALLPEGVVEAEMDLPVEEVTSYPYRILRARVPFAGPVGKKSPKTPKALA
jgi:hypothetical protein